jgi:ATP-dependent Clp protease protease subunit
MVYYHNSTIPQISNYFLEGNKSMNISDINSLIPMVIETTGRGERAFDIFSLLLRNRLIFLGTPLTDQVANITVAQLLYLNQEDRDAPINMYINSPGGQVYAGLAIYDAMQMISNPISTVAVGVTASFGTVLLAAGTKGQRYALPHATIHLHQPLGGAQGQVTDIEIQAKEFIRLRTKLNQILMKHTGQSEEVIERDTERDFWMDAKAAVDYGLVDEVLEAQSKEDEEE